MKVGGARLYAVEASGLRDRADLGLLRGYLRTARPPNVIVYVHSDAAGGAAASLCLLKACQEVLGWGVWDHTVIAALCDDDTCHERAAELEASLLAALGTSLPVVAVGRPAARALGGLVEEMAKVVRFTKPFLLEEPAGPPPAPAAGDVGGVRHLSELMDANLSLATSAAATSAATQPPPRRPITLPQAEESIVAKTQVPAWDWTAHTALALEASDMAVPRQRQPLIPAAASISLSIAAALQAPLLPALPRLGFWGQGKGAGAAAAFSPLSSVSVAPKKAARVPSQQECHRAMPVMSAAQALRQVAESSSPCLDRPMFVLGLGTAFPDILRLPDRGGGLSFPSSAAAGRKVAIMWFRSDLRIHDNEALAAAAGESLSVLPVYCFDPRDYGKSSSGFDKTGPYRAKFLLECVADLRRGLRARGSDLVVRVGRPEDVLLQLARAAGADALYAHQEVTREELQTEEKVAAALKEVGVETKLFWGSTLYHVEDLPFGLHSMPTNYGGFKDAVASVKVRPLAETPKRLKAMPARGNVDPGSIPTLQELGLHPAVVARKDAPPPGSVLTGGESEGLQRLQHFVDEASREAAAAPPASGQEGLYGASFSCKISPWLAMGCLSPRRMYEDLQASSQRMPAAAAAAAGGGAGGTPARLEDHPSLNWLVFELLWRDFFRFITKKYGMAKQTGGGGAPVPAPASAAALPALAAA